MTSHEELIRQIATEVDILSDHRFRHGALGSLRPPRDVEATPDRPLLAHLCRMIYLVYHVGDLATARLYFSGGRAVGTVQGFEDYDYTEKLHAANPGSGYWKAGWTVAEVREADYVVVRDDGLTLVAGPSEISAVEPRVGDGVLVRFPPEARYRAVGWYSVFGDAGSPDGEERVRLYFALNSPDAAPRLLRAVASELNALQIRFGLKTVNHPDGLARRDSFVVYFDRAQWHRHQDFFHRIQADNSMLLRDDYPRFSLRLAHGFSVAFESYPSKHVMSFGEHRSLLVGEGLLDAWERGRHAIDDKIAAIGERFASAGLDVRRPYLSAVGALT